MSHHSTEVFPGYDALVAKSPGLKLTLGLGATGEFPHGKIADHDEGEIRIGVAADRVNGVVLVDFGKSVRSIGFTAEQGSDLADLILEKVMEVRGIV
jgi:hypothetical protein